MSQYNLIEIIPYNPDWIKWYDQLKYLLEKSLGNLAISIDHIGSTAVPGLGSKNRIDVQVTIAEISQNSKIAIDTALKKADFKETELSRDHRPPWDNSPEDQWQKLYLPGEHPSISFDANIHFRAKGKHNQLYSLIFRDYLRSHSKARDAYQVLKEKLAQYNPHNIHAYVDIKDPACDIIMSAAEAWAINKRNNENF